MSRREANPSQKDSKKGSATSQLESPQMLPEQLAKASIAPSPISRRKRWAFRIAAAIGTPCLLFLVGEIVLRILGVGYPVNFYLRVTNDEHELLINNPQFGWRFFGPALSRTAGANSIVVEKPANTIRIIVLGESAAFGDPHSQYGLPRMISAILSLRHPDRRFEVINAAMTSINSHVIRDIARDNLAANSDIWVTYIGNNEVVGPFGAGTVFGRQAPPLPVVRATLALKSTRVGQELDLLLKSINQQSTSDLQWGGLMMFVNNYVRADEPRMQRVYEHFQQNLENIVDTAVNNGIGIVVSSVAVNLLDSAPFASALDPELSNEDQAAWTRMYQQAGELQDSGDHVKAMSLFNQAANIDDGHAELHFRLGRSLLAQGNDAEAGRHLQLACDLDTLRFRCDSSLNEITRQVAVKNGARGVRFVNAARELNERSKHGVAGLDFFYEHVHLTLEGNFHLARLISEEVEQLLPPIDGTVERQWPNLEQCAKLLAWGDWAHYIALTDIRTRLGDPPFTGQLSHKVQVAHVNQQLKSLSHATNLAALQAAVEICRDAIRVSPEDPVLYAQLAILLANTGNLSGSLDAASRVSELMPYSSEAKLKMGLVLAKLQRDQEALVQFQEALDLSSTQPQVLHEMAKTLFRLGRNAEGIQALRNAISINPRFGLAYMTLGAALEDQGQVPEAEQLFRQAIAQPPEKTADIARLAHVCEAHGWWSEALELYRKAIALSVDDPSLHFSAASCLAALGQSEKAEQEFQRVLTIDPTSPEPRFLWAAQQASRGKHDLAVKYFQDGLRLQPDHLNARIGLGVSLVALDQKPEAAREFLEVLRRDPSNEVARRYAAMLNLPLPKEK